MGNGPVDANYYFRVLWRRRGLVASGALAVGTVVLIVSLMLPKIYEAKATLIILPPRFSTELRPEALPVETYRAIAESEGIKNKVMRTLEGKGLSSRNDEIDADLSTLIYPSVSRDRAYLPLIELVVQAHSPAKAQLMAEVWAETVLNESAELSQRASKNVVDFIEQEFREAEGRLVEAENALIEAQSRRDRALADARKRWEKEIADFEAAWDLDGLTKELEAVRSILTQEAMPGSPARGLILELQNIRVETQRAKETLDRLKAEIEAHPQFLIQAKAITDDALWQNMGRTLDEVPEGLQTLKLRSELPNPVHESLALQLARTKVAYEALVPQETFLAGQIDEIRQRLQSLNRLLVTKKLEMENLIRDRDLELDRLARDYALLEKQLTRNIENTRATFAELAKKSESARLAKAEEDSDVKIGAAPAAGAKPVGPSVLLNTVVACLAGLAFMVALALVLEFAKGLANGRESASFPVGGTRTSSSSIEL